MNISAYDVLDSSLYLENNKFSTSVDPFYIGTGIGLVGAILVAIIRLHYLYHKKRNKQVDSINCSANHVIDTL